MPREGRLRPSKSMTGEGERVTEVEGETSSSVIVGGTTAATVEAAEVFLFFFLEGESSVGLSDGSRAGLLTLDRLSPEEGAERFLLDLSLFFFSFLEPLAMGETDPEGLSELSRVLSWAIVNV